MLRACASEMPLFYQIQGKEVSGVLQPVINSFFDHFTHFNIVSIVSAPSVGSLVQLSRQQQELLPFSPSFDGCLGSLQANESDVVIGPTQLLPSALPGSGISATAVTGAEVIAILSSYDGGTAVSLAGDGYALLSMITGFPLDLWSLVLSLLWLLAAVAAASVTSLTSSPRRGCKDAFALSVACFLKQHTSCPTVLATARRSGTRRTYLLMTLLSYFVWLFVGNLIKTDLVLLKQPLIVESYADLLAQQRFPVWLEAVGDSSEFASAQSGSLEAQVWRRATSRDISRSLMQPFLHSITSHLSFVEENKEAILMSRSFLTQLLTPAVCAISRARAALDTMFLVTRVDPHAREHLLASVTRASLDLKIREGVRKQAQRCFEAHLLAAAYRLTDATSLYGIASEERKPSSEVECRAQQIRLPDPQHQSIQLSQLSSLVLLSSLAVLTACVCLFCEAACGRLRGKRTVRESK